MKVKHLVAMAATTMLTASFAFAAPAAQPSDETTGGFMQPPTPTENVGVTPGPNGNPMTQAANDSSDMGPLALNTNNPMENGSSSDEISADTATGDDDY